MPDILHNEAIRYNPLSSKSEEPRQYAGESELKCYYVATLEQRLTDQGLEKVC